MNSNFVVLCCTWAINSLNRAIEIQELNYTKTLCVGFFFIFGNSVNELTVIGDLACYCVRFLILCEKCYGQSY